MKMEKRIARPVIIAMKGHPGTGKTTLARALASTLKIPLLDKDDIRDATLSLHHNSHVSSAHLNDLSYDALFRLASTQLRLGLSLILDSPLSSRRRLDQLLRSASGARLLIVECRPSDEDEWRRRLETRGAEGSSWHKPSTWHDLQSLLEGYRGCTDYDVGDAPLLVVDTTAPVQFQELLSPVVDFIFSHSAPSI